MSTFVPIDKIKYPKSSGKEFEAIFKRIIEIREVSNYISNLPVMPAYAEEIRKEEKIRAIRGTTGIEGNVLDENQIRTLLEKKDTGVSLAEIEVMNSGRVHDFIINWCANNQDGIITEPLIRQIHKFNTEKLNYLSNEPGKYRNFEVTYGYPPKKTPLKTESDIQIEMKKLVDWINDKSVIFPYPYPNLLKGILTHYAISRIHPFADGNGRTARAIEALLFCQAGINDYCFYGVANYCYRNRDTYIEELSKVDLTGDASNFLIFCINGFYESITYVKDRITNFISELMFMDYVHQLRRQRKLTKKAVEVLDFIMRLKAMPYSDFQKRHFMDRSDETKRRYLNQFMSLELIKIIEKDGKKETIIPNLDVLKSLKRKII